MAGHLAHLGLAEGLPQQSDILRCGAAAAAEYLYPHLGQGGQTLGKLLRGDVVARAIRVGQACIGLEHDREIGPCNQFLHQGRHLPGAQGTVDADGIGPHSLQGQSGAGGAATQEGAPGGLVGHGHHDGQGAVLFHGQQSGSGLL